MAQAFFQEDEILGKAYDGRLARRLWNFIHPYQRTIYITAIFACVMVVVDLLAPFLTQVAIDQYIAPKGATTLSIGERASAEYC